MEKSTWLIILFCVVMVIIFVFGCDKWTTRNFGGESTIMLPKNEKLIEATWKGNNLWYLTVPMDSNYVPKTKIFQESSMVGVLEGKVIFIESK